VSHSPGHARDRRQAALLIAPATLLLVGVALSPLVMAVWLSLHRVVVVFHEARFVGFDNYLFLFHDLRFRAALGTTTYFALVSVCVELLLGLLFAWLLTSAVPGRGLLRTSILVPWAIPTVVSAKLWAFLLNPDYGVLTRLLPAAQANVLGTPGWALHAAILVDVWKTTPFVTLLLLAGLQQIPEDLYQAAALDGASPWRIFRSITLPLLRPTIVITLVFRTLDAFRVFDAVYVLTEGGPANTTETLSIYAYKTLMRSGDFGYGTTLSVATFLCVMFISLLYFRLLGSGEEGPIS
jgi:multiple sugar transport system permease protein